MKFFSPKNSLIKPQRLSHAHTPNQPPTKPAESLEARMAALNESNEKNDPLPPRIVTDKNVQMELTRVEELMKEAPPEVSSQLQDSMTTLAKENPRLTEEDIQRKLAERLRQIFQTNPDRETQQFAAEENLESRDGEAAVDLSASNTHVGNRTNTYTTNQEITAEEAQAQTAMDGLPKFYESSKSTRPKPAYYSIKIDGRERIVAWKENIEGQINSQGHYYYIDEPESVHAKIPGGANIKQIPEEEVAIKMAEVTPETPKTELAEKTETYLTELRAQPAEIQAQQVAAMRETFGKQVQNKQIARVFKDQVKAVEVSTQDLAATTPETAVKPETLTSTTDQAAQALAKLLLAEASPENIQLAAISSMLGEVGDFLRKAKLATAPKAEAPAEPVETPVETTVVTAEPTETAVAAAEKPTFTPKEAEKLTQTVAMLEGILKPAEAAETTAETAQPATVSLAQLTTQTTPEISDITKPEETVTALAFAAVEQAKAQLRQLSFDIGQTAFA